MVLAGLPSLPNDRLPYGTMNGLRSLNHATQGMSYSCHTIFKKGEKYNHGHVLKSLPHAF